MKLPSRARWLVTVALLATGCWSAPTEPPIVVQQRGPDWLSRVAARETPQRLVARPFAYAGEETQAARRGVAALRMALEESGRFLLAPAEEVLAAPQPGGFPPKLPTGFRPDLVLVGQVIACRPYPPQTFGLSLRFEDPLDGSVLWQGTGVFDASSARTRADLEAWVDDAYANASREGAHNEALLSLERFQRYAATRWVEKIVEVPEQP